MHWDQDLASRIDHTLLTPTATSEDVRRACEASTQFGFAALVVHPYYVPMVARELQSTPVRVCSVVAFPFGAENDTQKAAASQHLIDAGAGEIDVVMNIGAFLSGDEAMVSREIASVVKACRRGRVVLKLIIETAYLSGLQIERAARLGVDGGVDFVKTSTGYGPRGASVDDVQRIRRVTGDAAGVKASGGIRTRKFALELLAAGATRLGCSTSLELVRLDSQS
jgi:deoxyribose-phosphate aldolase